MANPNPKHLQRLMEGVEAWNAWRRQHSDIIPDLCTINFGGADLTGVMLDRVDLRGSILDGANLRGADFSGANLGSTYLVGADLSMANLVWANLSKANLSRTDVSHASFDETIFGDTDLTAVRGIETCTDRKNKAHFFSVSRVPPGAGCMASYAICTSTTTPGCMVVSTGRT